MASKKISQLNAITEINDLDILPIVDENTDETKKITIGQLKDLIDHDTMAVWGQITGDILDQTDLMALFDEKATVADLSSHVSDQNNPHNVTKSQIGLGNADNTSDVNKPISTATQTALNLKLNSSEKGAINGVATLGADQKIPTSQLPALAITNTFVVLNQSEMLALSAETGDIAVRIDLNKSFILTANDPSVLGNWQELLTPTDAVLSVNGFTGAITLTTSDISEGSNLYFTNARSRSSISETITGIDYNNTTGVFSITSGYAIPTSAKQTEWDTAYGWGNHASAGYLTTSVASSTYVPYTGANANINIGTFNFGLSGVINVDRSYIDFTNVVTPTAPSLALQGVAGLVPVRTNYYAVTYITAIGETVRSLTTTIVVASSANAQVMVTIPVSADPKVIGRKIWRGGDSANMRPLATINDNTTTTYLDNLADSGNVEQFLGGTTSGAFFQNGVKVMQLDTLGSLRLGGLDSHVRIGKTNAGYGLISYNTVDEKEDIEFGGTRWSSNIFEIGTFARGGGAARKVRIKSSNASVSLNLDIERAGTDWLSVIDSGTSGASSFVRFNPTNWTSTGGENRILTLGSVALNNTSSGGYSLFNIDATNGTGGSGSKLFARFTLGGVTTWATNYQGAMTINKTMLATPIAMLDIVTLGAYSDSIPSILAGKVVTSGNSLGASFRNLTGSTGSAMIEIAGITGGSARPAQIRVDDTGTLRIYTGSTSYSTLGTERFNIDNTGNTSILGVANLAPNQTITSDNSLMTLKTTKDTSQVNGYYRDIPLDSGWTIWASAGYTAANSPLVKRISGTNAAGGAVTVTQNGDSAQRSRIGKNRTTGGFGSIDFASRIKIDITLGGVSGRFAFATEDFAITLGTHVAYDIATFGVDLLNDTASPGSNLSLIGFRVKAGAVQLAVKNGTGATTYSSTLVTLTDATDIGQFTLISESGIVYLYRNEVLLGSMSGAPNAMITNPASIGIAFASSRATITEMAIHHCALSWR